MSKDIGNKCVYCLEDLLIVFLLIKDTSFGSDGIYDGYQCPDCQIEDSEEEDK